MPELLRALAAGSHLLLDLKGRNRRLSTELLSALDPHLGGRFEITLCSRIWPLLEPFAGVPGVRLIHSVGSARQLRRLRFRAAEQRLHGISIHERLLDARTARELRDVADVIFSWPVNTVERAQELIACGVEGLISDRPDLVHPVAAAATP